MFEAILSLPDGASIGLIGVFVLAAMFAAAAGGVSFRGHHKRAGKFQQADSQEGYVVSAMLGLLALLMGFTFALAVDRYETRRVLVLEDANAIGTAYLRAQLLGEPHRSRLSGLLVAYTDNMIQLAQTERGQNQELLARDDRLLTDMWSATAAAFDSIRGLDFSSALVISMNTVIDLDASRRAARQAHVPTPVFVALLAYLLVTAALLGYVLLAWRTRIAGSITLALLTLSFVLVIDIDRPTTGTIRETQGPMEQLQQSLRSQPPRVFDRWRTLAELRQ
jgi:hypothetical protein